MKLAEYLDQSELSPPEFASEIGIDPNTVRRIMNGFEPSLSIALLIESYTRNLVKCKELVGTKTVGRGRPRADNSERRKIIGKD